MIYCQDCLMCFYILHIGKTIESLFVHIFVSTNKSFLLLLLKKYEIDVFFPAEHDPAVSLPLLVQEKVGNSKNRKIEKPL